MKALDSVCVCVCVCVFGVNKVQLDSYLHCELKGTSSESPGPVRNIPVLNLEAERRLFFSSSSFSFPIFYPLSVPTFYNLSPAFLPFLPSLISLIAPVIPAFSPNQILIGKSLQMSALVN